MKMVAVGRRRVVIVPHGHRLGERKRVRDMGYGVVPRGRSIVAKRYCSCVLTFDKGIAAHLSKGWDDKRMTKLGNPLLRLTYLQISRCQMGEPPSSLAQLTEKLYPFESLPHGLDAC
jgi:hypothetical protein